MSDLKKIDLKELKTATHRKRCASSPKAND